jgi:hypothetical protein
MLPRVRARLQPVINVFRILPCRRWFRRTWRLCEDLEPLVANFEQASGRQFEVLQVKEKFGGLRI